jgi:KduI/IolB family
MGERMSVFEKLPPHCLYVPAESGWSAAIDCVLAVCTAPGKPGRKAQKLGPPGLSLEERGKGANTRFIHRHCYVNLCATGPGHLELKFITLQALPLHGRLSNGKCDWPTDVYIPLDIYAIGIYHSYIPSKGCSHVTNDNFPIQSNSSGSPLERRGLSR